jgi:hypothetical protein
MPVIVHGNWTKNTLFQLAILGRCQGQAIVNVFHYEVTGVQEALLLSDAQAVTRAAAMADDFRLNCLTAWRNAHTSDYSVLALRSQVLERPGNYEHRLIAQDNTTGMPAAGNLAPVADDLTTAAVVRWRSLSANRHGRGRTYVGPLEQGSTDVGTIAGAYIATLTTWADLMITRYTGVGVGEGVNSKLTVYNRPYDSPDGAYTRRIAGVLTVVNDNHAYDGDSNNIVSHAIDATARVQRRRELGVGS